MERMFAKLPNLPWQPNSIFPEELPLMATQSSNGKAKSTAKKATKTAPKTTAKAADKNQVQTFAEAAVDFPVGAVLPVTDRISDAVEPWTSRGSVEKQIKAYRTEVRKSLKRAERRGTT